MRRWIYGIVMLVPTLAAGQSTNTLSASVKPGYEFSSGERVTLNKLNLLGVPTVTISGSVSGSTLSTNSVDNTKLQTNVFDQVTITGGDGTAGAVNYDDWSLGVVSNKLAIATNGVNTVHLTDGSVTSNKLDLTALQSVFPTGAIIPYGGSSAPASWLLCDGSAISRTTYSNLYSIVSTNFGAGNGSTTFNVPDLRRRVPMGAGGTGTATITNLVGSTGGEETHTLLQAELPDVDFEVSNQRVSADGNIANAGGSIVGIGTTYTDITAASGGSGTPFNVIQPSLVVNYIIKY